MGESKSLQAGPPSPPKTEQRRCPLLPKQAEQTDEKEQKDGLSMHGHL